ncbi:MAG: class I SAM-dependent RNA methyltransferase [Lachnospiraceae bacterium]
MKRGQLIEGTAVRADYPDRAVILTDEGEAEVKGVLPGQKVTARIKKTAKGRAKGTLVEILERSPEERPETACPHFGVCGGCYCESLPYDDQLRLKEGQMRRLLAGVLPDGNTECFEGILASPEQEGYRNKMELTFGDLTPGGPLTLGQHRRNSFYDICDVPGCRNMPADMKAAASCVRDFYDSLGVPFYHRMRQAGILRHLLLRRSRETGEMMAALVTTSSEQIVRTRMNLRKGRPAGGTSAEQWSGEALEKLREQTAQRLCLDGLVQKLLSLPLEGRLSGILHIWNDSPADVVQSDRTDVLYGSPVIHESLLGLHFEIAPFSFFQTNSAGAEVLYSTVREFAGSTESRRIFDLYSGTGTIAQLLAPAAESVTGIEIVESAVEDARRNAARNGLSNCTFIAGDVLTELDAVEEKPDLIILDPPRDGIHPKALPKILSYGVPCIVYVSCKPTSFTRDYPAFEAAGYRLARARAVDMFPGTSGTELVSCLVRS